MAQSRKRRSRKHAGTQAGTVERRGRTSKPGAPPSKADQRVRSREERTHRLDQPPTWRGAITRAGISALIFAVLVVIVFGRTPLQGLSLGVAMFVIYVPMAYFTDRFLFNRRQRQKARAAG